MSLRTYTVVACDRLGCQEEAAPASTQQRAEEQAARMGWTRTPVRIQGTVASWRHLCPYHSGGMS